MDDYQVLDISTLYNAGAEILNAEDTALTGKLFFRGLPFLVGPDKGTSGDKCFMWFDSDATARTIPVNQTGQTVIFAHRLLDTDIMKGGPLGKHVADYVFNLSGGEQVRVPVRERFEIGAITGSNALGGTSFRAYSDIMDSLLPRDQGPWDMAGRRQTEAERGMPQSYFLWAWRNPNPDQEIQSIEIVPKGPSFLIAGITLGHLDEHPFVKEGRREVKVTLKDPDAARSPFNVEVDVDRGVATYVYPLPDSSEQEYLDDPNKGFGEPENPGSSPAYVEIAATPSATITVKQDGTATDSVRWGDVESKGVAETSRIKLELLDRGRNWVHVTVLDDATGQPVPCRVHFRSPEGIPYQPHGHHNQVNSNMGTWHIDVGGDVRLGRTTYAYIDGTCQGWLPRGDVLVDVARGPEYEPLRTRVRIEPGQQQLTLRLKRWIDMNKRRWFSGDSHVHFLSTQGSHLESQGEDLNIVNLLQSQWGSLFTNTEEFTGGPSVSQDGNNIIYVSQENRQHFLGHMILWGLKEPVMPWCSDGLSEGELGGTMETTMSHWADAAHAQGGSVIIPHFPHPNGEPATLVSTGRVDAVEMIRQEQFNHIEYYRYLNCGYRLPLVGGTDKMSNEVPVGLYRTYAYVPDDQEFTYDNWRKAVSQGRTFLSGGPIIHFSVEGKQAGDTLKLSGTGTIEIEAWAESVLPIHSLEIVQEGRVVASTAESNGARRLELKTKVNVEGDTWLAARCGGPNHYDSLPYLDVWDRGIFAHTSPVYVTTGDDWYMFDEQAAKYMLTLIEGGLTYVRDSATQHAPGSITHHHGEDDHVAYLERPFLQARDAIQQRLHRHGISH